LWGLTTAFILLVVFARDVPEVDAVVITSGGSSPRYTTTRDSTAGSVKSHATSGLAALATRLEARR